MEFYLYFRGEQLLSKRVAVSLIHLTSGVLAIYMGKPEIPGAKSNGSRHSVWEASENMGCDLS